MEMLEVSPSHYTVVQKHQVPNTVGLTSYRSIIKNSFDDAVVFSLDHIPSGMIIATISQHTIHDHHREVLKAGV